MSDLQSALEMDGTIQVERSLIKIDVADGKRNERGGGFDRRGRGGGGAGGGSGGGFRGRDGGGRGGYSDDFGREPTVRIMRYASRNAIVHFNLAV